MEPFAIFPKVQMKNFKHIAVCLFLLSSLFMVACDGTYTSDTKSFEGKLRGTWVSNETGVYNEGKIATSSDGITWTAVADTGLVNSTSGIKVVYGNGRFVAGGARGHMAYYD